VSIYCWKCRECGFRVEGTKNSSAYYGCGTHRGDVMIRDYRAENVSMALVPGGAKMAGSATYYDKDSLLRDFGETFHRDNVMEHRSRVRDAIEDEG
jgi:hypothetical protein